MLQSFKINKQTLLTICKRYTYLRVSQCLKSFTYLEFLVSCRVWNEQTIPVADSHPTNDPTSSDCAMNNGHNFCQFGLKKTKFESRKIKSHKYHQKIIEVTHQLVKMNKSRTYSCVLKSTLD